MNKLKPEAEMSNLEILVVDLEGQVTDLEHVVDELREELDALKRKREDDGTEIDRLRYQLDDIGRGSEELDELKREREDDRAEIDRLRAQLDDMERFQDEQLKAHAIALHEAEILFERLEKALTQLPGGAE